ncbi:hypothetical protein F53441_7164 [Fusarium austroafricanum]|uniref:Heterokaryon incompatibility domain-containing protein n=1 Tax=Fusarium austroafricanum TaxID=2364996 RepID=A0A8H4P676_9HYPO|nr:hypothetical protein F53441_7164 [Fusarium austroafricanum]
MSNNMDCHLYTPLDRSRQEIRLIEIISIEPIICHLITVSLDDNPTFSAISYLWGDAENTERVIVNGIEQAITPSLANALEYVPHHWKREFPQREPSSCRLWADALCINQNDDLEKGHQVQLMKSIYSSAELVFSCLDIDAQESDIYLAFETCEMMARYALQRGLVRQAHDFDFVPTKEQAQDLAWLLKHPFLAEDYPIGSQKCNEAEKAMFQTLTLRYWERAWIFQETVLAKRLLVIHKVSSISLEVLLQVQSCVEIIEEMASKSKQTNSDFLFWSSYFRTCQPLRNIDWARSCVHNVVDIRESILQSMRSAAFLFVGDRDAKNPKDHVYSLLGITNFSIEPDYTNRTSVASVYSDLWAKMLESRQPASCFPLCFLSGGGLFLQDQSQPYELPSWVYNFPRMFISYKVPNFLFRGLSHGNYVSPEEWDNLETAVVRGNSLVCSAAFITTLGCTSTALDSSQNAWPKFVSSVLSMIYQPMNSSEPPHPLWKLARTFGAEDLEVDIWEAPEVIRLIRIFQYLLFLNQVPVDGDGTADGQAVDKAEAVAEEILHKLTEDVLKQENEQSQQDSTFRDCQELVSRIKDSQSFWEDIDNGKVNWDVKFFLQSEPRVCLTENGEFVVIPRMAEKGDQVVLVPGHWQLSLIRKVEDHFVYIGDCWPSRSLDELAEQARTAKMERIEIR